MTEFRTLAQRTPETNTEDDFQLTLARLYPHLRARAMLLTQRRDAADDLVQELCERALRRQDSFQPGTNALGWLTRIMRNIFIDDYRSQRSRASVERSGGELEPVEPRVPTDGLPAHQLEPRTGAVDQPSIYDLLGEQDVLDAIATLPPAHQTLFRLAHFSGLTYRELQRRTGLRIQTVGTRLFRSRRRLKAILETTYQARLRALDHGGAPPRSSARLDRSIERSADKRSPSNPSHK